MGHHAKRGGTVKFHPVLVKFDFGIFGITVCGGEEGWVVDFVRGSGGVCKTRARCGVDTKMEP